MATNTRSPEQQLHCDFVDALREFLGLAPIYRSERPTNYEDLTTINIRKTRKARSVG